MNMRLTIHRRGAPSRSGVYDWCGALARLAVAAALPDFQDFELTEARP